MDIDTEPFNVDDIDYETPRYRRESQPQEELRPYTVAEELTAEVEMLRTEVVRLYSDVRDKAMAGMTTANNPIFSEIAAERAVQDAKWGGPDHDDTHSRQEWHDLIAERNDSAPLMHPMEPNEEYRRRMIQVSALAWAAVESYDRIQASRGS